MIVEEQIEGVLCRYHPNPDDPKYTASWILTPDGEIKAFSMTEVSREFAGEFAAWVQSQQQPLKAYTAVRSVDNVIRRFGFKEFTRRHDD